MRSLRFILFVFAAALIGTSAAWGQSVEIVTPHDGHQINGDQFTIVARSHDQQKDNFFIVIWTRYPDVSGSFAKCEVGFSPYSGAGPFSHEVSAVACDCVNDGDCYSEMRIMQPHIGDLIHGDKIITVVAKNIELEESKYSHSPWPPGVWDAQVKILNPQPKAGDAEVWVTVEK